MKSINNFIIIALLILGTQLTGCKSLEFPVAPGSVTLTLEVDTDKLLAASPVNNKNQVEKHCNLMEVRNGNTRNSGYGKLKKFKTAVISQDNIVWEATSSNPDHTVTVINVTPFLTRSNDINFFTDYVLNADGDKVNKNVKILPPGKRNYPYLIFFEVDYGEGPPTEYFVDPKLMAQ